MRFVSTLSTSSASPTVAAQQLPNCLTKSVSAAGSFLSAIWSDPSLHLPRLLRSCIPTHSLLRAREIHSIIITSGVSSDKFISNHLLNVYAKLGEMDAAAAVFDIMPRKNVMTWNIMIGGYLQNDDLVSARRMFYEMSERNVATWSAMVTGVTNYGFNEEGLELFREMRRWGFQPDEFTLGSALRGCAGVKDVQSGCQLQVYVIRAGFQHDLCVGNSLAHMYMNCGLLKEGESIVEAIPESSIVSCNTVIAGRVQNGDAEGALSHFYRMKLAGFTPDQITFTSVLTACSELATLGQGMQIHTQAMKTGVDSVLAVQSSLVSMYSKCGCLSESIKMFRESAVTDYVLWSAVIAACGFHGHGKEAIGFFEQMLRQGKDPNAITFLSLLYACSHSGLKEQGKKFFKLMTDTYKLEPRLEHYTCMVDLLGRSGCLEEAEELIESMPVKPDVVIWKTLLSACKIHRNARMAERLAEHVLRLDPQDSAPYVLLSQIHASKKRWKDVSEVREYMKEKKVRKEPGVSWVEVRNEVHQFSMGDRSHPMHKEIHDYLRELVAKMKELGYVADITTVFHDMEDEEKEYSLAEHSEKLAVAFAILSTPDGAVIRVMKNLRVCNDCHVAIKLISKITSREIVVRDVSRFHHVRDGECSCGDYW